MENKEISLASRSSTLFKFILNDFKLYNIVFFNLVNILMEVKLFNYCFHCNNYKKYQICLFSIILQKLYVHLVEVKLH